MQLTPLGVVAVHAHWPAEQPMLLVAQRFRPHAPQLFGSDWVFTHEPLHISLGELQVHSVPEQVSLVGQASVVCGAHEPLPSHICFKYFVDPVHDCAAPQATVVG